MGKKEEQEMHRDERIEQTGQLTLTDNKEETSIPSADDHRGN